MSTHKICCLEEIKKKKKYHWLLVEKVPYMELCYTYFIKRIRGTANEYNMFFTEK